MLGYDPPRCAVLVHELWPRVIQECPMCGEVKPLTHAVAWYCGPTHDEIGSITTEYTDGGEVGGMCTCKTCHDNHYRATPKHEGGQS